ncbi:MAG: S8 family peptidase [Saprospiraceae bacterium]
MIYLFVLLSRFLSGGPVSIDPLVDQSLKTKGYADILCILKSPYQNLAQITTQFDTKEQMGQFVFERLKTYSDQSQRLILSQLQKDHIDFQSFFIVNAIHIPHADASLINYLSSRTEVDRIEYNSVYSLQQPIKATNLSLSPLESRSPLAIEWGILRIRADSLWSLGIKGKGAVIGGEDTGVQLHPLIKNSYRGTLSSTLQDDNYNWHDAIHSLSPLNHDSTTNKYNNPCGLDTLGPCDDNNHGTHTMGTMAATDNMIGVAPEAKWIACRCMERDWGSPASYIECFQFFLAPTDLTNKNPDPKKAPHVINNSWGCPAEEGCNPSNFKTMEQAIKNLKAAGVFVTVSAGNSGGLGCSSINDAPAIFESSFTVGAINMADEITGFSSKGPVRVDSSFRLKPDLTAPGQTVLSTIRNGGFAFFSGTSMSGPHVAGAVALLISAFPSLAGKVSLIENILKQSADQKPVNGLCSTDSIMSYPNNIYGYGILNVYKAYQLAKTLLTTPVKEQKTVESIRVFPNPSDSYVWFEVNPTDHATTISMINLHGQILLQQKNINQSLFYIDVTSLPAGMYYYKVTSKNKVYDGKVLVSH